MALPVRTTSQTDDGYRWRLVPIGKEFARHDIVDHGKDEYVRSDVHSNTVEGYFSILKRGIIGTFHSVSEAHLHRYLKEFDFRYSTRSARVEDTERAALALKGAEGKRIPSSLGL